MYLDTFHHCIVMVSDGVSSPLCRTWSWSSWLSGPCPPSYSTWAPKSSRSLLERGSDSPWSSLRPMTPHPHPQPVAPHHPYPYCSGSTGWSCHLSTRWDLHLVMGSLLKLYSIVMLRPPSDLMGQSCNSAVITVSLSSDTGGFPVHVHAADRQHVPDVHRRLPHWLTAAAKGRTTEPHDTSPHRAPSPGQRLSVLRVSPQNSIAIVPLVMYVSGLACSLLMKPVSRLLGISVSLILTLCYCCCASLCCRGKRKMRTGGTTFSWLQRINYVS